VKAGALRRFFAAGEQRRAATRIRSKTGPLTTECGSDSDERKSKWEAVPGIAAGLGQHDSATWERPFDSDEQRPDVLVIPNPASLKIRKLKFALYDLGRGALRALSLLNRMWT
jgi:hypothetical protein